jgi:hypothetical protein
MRLSSPPLLVLIFIACVLTALLAQMHFVERPARARLIAQRDADIANLVDRKSEVDKFGAEIHKVQAKASAVTNLYALRPRTGKILQGLAECLPGSFTVEALQLGKDPEFSDGRHYVISMTCRESGVNARENNELISEFMYSVTRQFHIGGGSKASWEWDVNPEFNARFQRPEIDAIYIGMPKEDEVNGYHNEYVSWKFEMVQPAD